MIGTKAPAVTRHDYAQMPEGPPYFQIIKGELVMSPSPTTPHQTVIGNLYHLFRSFLEKHRVGEVHLAPLDVFLSDTNVYQPDLLYLSTERTHLIGERGIEGAPDLVAEVLSPGTRRYDEGSKRKVYARAGVRELWLIDPHDKSFEVHRFDGDAVTPVAAYADEFSFETPVIPGLAIRAGEVFRSV